MLASPKADDIHLTCNLHIAQVLVTNTSELKKNIYL